MLFLHKKHQSTVVMDRIYLRHDCKTYTQRSEEMMVAAPLQVCMHNKLVVRHLHHSHDR